MSSFLSELGTIHFGRIHMKPGKPTTFATVPRPNSDAVRHRLVIVIEELPIHFSYKVLNYVHFLHSLCSCSDSPAILLAVLSPVCYLWSLLPASSPAHPPAIWSSAKVAFACTLEPLSLLKTNSYYDRRT